LMGGNSPCAAAEFRVSCGARSPWLSIAYIF
jgi:hypothetical protein